jgi:hypothetical protein
VIKLEDQAFVTHQTPAPQQRRGLLDAFVNMDPQTKRGLLDFGLNMLAQGNAPTGQAMGRAGLLSMDQRFQRDQQEQQAKRQAMHDQLLQGQVAQQQRQRSFVDSLQAPTMAASQAALAGGGGPTMDNAARMPAVSPMQEQMFGAMKAGVVGPMDYLKSMQPERAKIKEYREVRGGDGSVTVVGFDELGKPVHTGMQPFIKPEVRDFGGFLGAVDAITSRVSPLGNKTATPDALVQASTTRRGQDLTDARSREANALTREAQQTQLIDTPTGPLLVNKGRKTADRVLLNGEAVPGEGVMKRTAGATRVLALLEQAEKILPSATNSWAGAGADLGASVIGYGTKGAQGVGRLKAIEGALLSEMPRMEGPQSNYDVAMYRQAAGQIGDATTPNSIKKAAIATMREIQERYANQGGGAGGSWEATPGEWSIKPAGR